jgi:hypothetical protein
MDLMLGNQQSLLQGGSLIDHGGGREVNGVAEWPP